MIGTKSGEMAQMALKLKSQPVFYINPRCFCSSLFLQCQNTVTAKSRPAHYSPLLGKGRKHEQQAITPSERGDLGSQACVSDKGLPFKKKRGGKEKHPLTFLKINPSIPPNRRNLSSN